MNNMKDTIYIYNLSNMGYKNDSKCLKKINDLKLLEYALLKQKDVETFKPKILGKNIEECKKESHEFIKSHFKFHDICYMTEYDEEKEIISFSDNVSPFSIPLTLTDVEVSNIVCKQINFPNLGKFNIVKEILISSKINEFTPSIITHELTHTQLFEDCSNKNFANSEVLPIFLEFLHYQEKNNLKDDSPKITRRKYCLLKAIVMLVFLATEMKYEEEKQKSNSLMNTEKYIESTLKVLYLYDIYEKSSLAMKKEILKYIQSIFSFNKSVEDLLDNYDVNFDNSLEYLQKKYK